MIHIRQRQHDAEHTHAKGADPQHDLARSSVKRREDDDAEHKDPDHGVS